MGVVTSRPEAVHQQHHYPPPAYTHPAAYPKQGTNGKAIAGFVLTLIGFVILPIVFSTIGIILAVIARKEITRNPGQEGRGLATAALIIGPLGFVAGIAVAILMNA